MYVCVRARMLRAGVRTRCCSLDVRPPPSASCLVSAATAKSKCSRGEAPQKHTVRSLYCQSSAQDSDVECIQYLDTVSSSYDFNPEITDYLFFVESTVLYPRVLSVWVLYYIIRYSLASLVAIFIFICSFLFFFFLMINHLLSCTVFPLQHPPDHPQAYIDTRTTLLEPPAQREVKTAGTVCLRTSRRCFELRSRRLARVYARRAADR